MNIIRVRSGEQQGDIVQNPKAIQALPKTTDVPVRKEILLVMDVLRVVFTVV